MKKLQWVFGLALLVISSVSFAQTININTATAKELDKGLAGVGRAKAEAIVRYREANGPFQSVDDLAKVPGIKAKTIEKIKPLVSVGETTGVPPLKVPANPTIPAAEPARMGVPANPVAPTAVPQIKTPANPVAPEAAVPVMKGPANPTAPAAPAVRPAQ